MPEKLTPEQLPTALDLTFRGCTNLRWLDNRWCGLRYEDGRTWLYLGLIVHGDDIRSEVRESFEDGNRAVRRIEGMEET